MFLGGVGVSGGGYVFRKYGTNGTVPSFDDTNLFITSPRHIVHLQWSRNMYVFN